MNACQRAWIRCREEDAYVEVAGEVDFESAELLRSAIDRVVRRGPPTVTVDLRKVTFFDRAGLDVLRSCRRRAAQAGIQLKLEPVPEVVGLLLNLAGYHRDPPPVA